ncbi:hypothetical protein ABK040_012218 [Willaertia magna]
MIANSATKSMEDDITTFIFFLQGGVLLFIVITENNQTFILYANGQLEIQNLIEPLNWQEELNSNPFLPFFSIISFNFKHFHGNSQYYIHKEKCEKLIEKSPLLIIPSITFVLTPSPTITDYYQQSSVIYQHYQSTTFNNEVKKELFLESEEEINQLDKFEKSSWCQKSIIFPNWLIAGEKIQTFSVCKNILVIVTNSNHIYIFGNSSPIFTQCLGKKIFLKNSQNNKTLQFGLKLLPYLHFNNVFESIMNLSFLTNINFQVIDVSCGEHFIVLLCKNYECFVIGDNSIYSIGLNSATMYRTLQPFRFNLIINKIENIKQIYCGNNFSTFLTESGKVYITGSFASLYYDKLTLLKENAFKIYSKNNCFIILLKDLKTVCWIGKVKFNSFKYELKLPNLDKEYIISIYCSNSYCSVLTNVGRLYYFGYDLNEIKNSLQEIKIVKEMNNKTLQLMNSNLKNQLNLTEYLQFNNSDLTNYEIEKTFIYLKRESFLSNLETKEIVRFKKVIWKGLNTFCDLEIIAFH